MPCSSIAYQQDYIVRILLRKFFKKYIGTFRSAFLSTFKGGKVEALPQITEKGIAFLQTIEKGGTLVLTLKAQNGE